MENNGVTLTESINKDDQNIRGFVIFYILIVLSFLLLGPHLFSSKWVSSSDFHACRNISGSFIAIIAGFTCLMYYFGLGNRYFLIIGLGFFISGSEDFIHGLLGFKRLYEGTGMDLSRFIYPVLM